MGEKSFFSTRFLFVSSCASEGGIEFKFFQGIQKGNGLKSVAAWVGPLFFYSSSFIDRVLYIANYEVGPDVLYHLIPEVKRFLEIVTGIYMQKRERDLAWPKGFL